MYSVSLHSLKFISRLWSNGSNYLRSAYSTGYVYFCFSQGKWLQVLASLQDSALLGEPKKTSTFAIWQAGPKYLTWMFDLMIRRVARAGQHNPLSCGVAVDCKLLSNSLLWRDPALSHSDYNSQVSNANLLTNYPEFLRCHLSNIGNSVKGTSSKIPVRFACVQVSVAIGITQPVTCKN